MTAQRRRVRRLSVVTVLFALLFTLLPTSIPKPTLLPAADAAYATGGSGLHKGSINWFEWPASLGLTQNVEKTFTSPATVGGVQMVITCSLRRTSVADIKSYVPGSYVGDGLDDLYNSGATGTANTMRIGLANAADGGQPTATIKCKANLGTAASPGAVIPLQGMVVADAEASNYAVLGTKEYLEVTPTGTATWRIIDRNVNTACATNAQGFLTSPNTLTLRPDGSECYPSNVAVAFMDVGTPAAEVSATLKIVGGGTSAIAFGVVLSTDYGDAPATYGDAAAIFTPTWSGGIVTGNSVFPNNFTRNFTLAALNSSNAIPRFGATVTAESKSQPSVDANLDTDDGLTGPITIPTAPGATYSGLRTIDCVGEEGAVGRGWIDWNVNGVFDNDEASKVGTGLGVCTAGKMKLEWDVPASASSANKQVADLTSYMRIRIGTSAAQLTQTGLSTSGEVEDYKVTLQYPRLEITKTSDFDPTKPVVAGTVVNYTVTARNIGPVEFPATGDGRATFIDSYAGVSPYISSGPSGVTATYRPSGNSAGTVTNTTSTQKLSWIGGLGANASVEIKYSVVLKDPVESQNNSGGFVAGLVRNVAYAPIANQPTPTCSPATAGKDQTTGQPCGLVEYGLPNVIATKVMTHLNGVAVAPGAEVRVNDVLTYTMTFKNDGKAAGSVAYRDYLAGWNSNATLTTSAPVVSPVGALTVTSAGIGNNAQYEIAGTIQAGQSATVTYQVRVNPVVPASSSLTNVLTKRTTGSNSCEASLGDLCTTNAVIIDSLVTVTKQAVDVRGNAIDPAGWKFTGTIQSNNATISGVPAPGTSVIRTTAADGMAKWQIVHASAQAEANFRITEDTNSMPGYEFQGYSCQLTIPGAAGAMAIESASSPTVTLTGLKNGSSVNCAFTNKQKPGSVAWQKTDTSGTYLAGSKWEITETATGIKTAVVDCVAATAAGCATPVPPATSIDTDHRAGYLKLSGLPWGAYTLVETTAPDGYKLDPTPHPFNITGSLLDATFQAPFKNEMRDPLLIPLTGGLGSYIFTILGASVLGLSAGAAFLRRRHRSSAR